jgi:hypothetical protein
MASLANRTRPGNKAVETIFTTSLESPNAEIA